MGSTSFALFSFLCFVPFPSTEEKFLVGRERGRREGKGRKSSLVTLSWKLINEKDGINRGLISFCLKKREKEEEEEEEGF